MSELAAVDAILEAERTAWMVALAPKDPPQM